MLSRPYHLFSLLIREALSQSYLERHPEPTTTMDDPQNVAAWHAEGASTGSILPIYHFNALGMSRLLPRGGTLLDLGSGSGQYLTYLATCRPDIQVIGVDLAGKMVEVGNRALEEIGLKARVELRVGDMTSFSQQLPERVDVVSSVFALHHLPTTADLVRCLEEIARVRTQYDCKVWIFDLVRPRHPRTAEDYPKIFTPEAPVTFRQDATNSLIAAFSFDELSTFLDQTSMGTFHHVYSRLMRLYQVHWLEGQGQNTLDHEALWIRRPLSRRAAKEFRHLRNILRSVPLPEQ